MEGTGRAREDTTEGVGVGLGLHAEEDLVHHAEGRGTGGLGADLEGGQGLDQEAEDLDPIL